MTTIDTVTIGPGLLKLGDPKLGAEVRLLSCTISWSESVTTTDPRKVLSGGQTRRKSKALYTATISGKIVQDFDSGAGLVSWSWVNKGTDQPFLYVPNSDVDRAVQGECRPIPFDVGGDVDVDGPEADFAWACVGDDPVLGAYDPVEGTVEADV